MIGTLVFEKQTLCSKVQSSELFIILSKTGEISDAKRTENTPCGAELERRLGREAWRRKTREQPPRH